LIFLPLPGKESFINWSLIRDGRMEVDMKATSWDVPSMLPTATPPTPLFMGDPESAAWDAGHQNFDATLLPLTLVMTTQDNLLEILQQEADVPISSIQDYLSAVQRMGARVELVGRELSYRVKDEAAHKFVRKRGQSDPRSESQEENELKFFIKTRFAEFHRAVCTHSKLMEKVHCDSGVEISTSERMMIAEEFSSLMARPW
jgi:hypothetical protein